MPKGKAILSKEQIENVAGEVVKKNDPYRDERGVRIQKYKRFEVGKDYSPVDADDMVILMQSAIDMLEDVKRRGRPRKYENVEELMEATQNYFKYISDANQDGVHLVPDVEGLCTYLQISRSQLFEWERNRGEDFQNAIGLIKNTIASMKKQLALKGKIPPIVFATDFNNNHGYVQKQQMELQVEQKKEEVIDELAIAQEYAEALPDNDL